MALQRCLLTIVLWAFFPVALVAQTDLSALQQELASLQSEISRREERINANRIQESERVRLVEDLANQRSAQEAVWSNLRQQQDSLRRDVERIETSVDRTRAEMDAVRLDYQARARQAYVQGEMSDLFLVLLSRSVVDALARARYMGRYSALRSSKLMTLDRLSDRLSSQLDSLQQVQRTLAGAVVAAEEALRAIDVLKEEQQQVIQTLRAESGRIEAELQTRKDQVALLTNRITELIERSRSAPATNFDMTRFARLSGSFSSNRGLLPWPAEGRVIERYGTIRHPVFGTETENPGIMVSARGDTPIRAVFDGTVASVDIVPGFGTYVVIGHGTFNTVYGNLSDVMVAPGAMVAAGTVVGGAGGPTAPKGEGYFFALFDEGRTVDPLLWLADD